MNNAVSENRNRFDVRVCWKQKNDFVIWKGKYKNSESEQKPEGEQSCITGFI